MKMIRISDDCGTEYFINLDRIIFCRSRNHLNKYEITFKAPKDVTSTIEVDPVTEINGKFQDVRAFFNGIVHNDLEALANKLMEKQYDAVEKMLRIRDEQQYQNRVYEKLMQKETEKREGAPQHDLSMVRIEVLQAELDRRSNT